MCLPFFKILKNNKVFEWTNESKMVFQQLKKCLGLTPLLTIPKMGEELIFYLSISPTIVSAVLILEEGKFQKSVYYINKVLIGAKTRYLKIEKLIYALLIAARKLCHYF